MGWSTRFTSLAALKCALDEMKRKGRVFVNTYGEMCMYVIRTAEENVDTLNEQVSQKIYEAEEQCANRPDEPLLRLERPLVEVEWLTEAEREEDAFYRDMFNGAFEQFASRLRLGGWFPPQRERTPAQVPIVTFYSFKGGVGRSTALALCALKLAQKGFRVVAVDMDLEAPGVASQLLIPADSYGEGVVDYLFKKAISQEGLPADAVKRYLVKVSSTFTGSGELWVMPAGPADETYPERLSRIDIDLFELRAYKPLQELFTALQQSLRPDVVLVDARTGIAEIGGPLLFHYSTAFVGLFYGDTQSQLGIAMLLSRLKELNEQSRPPQIWAHALLRHAPDDDDGFHREAQAFLQGAYERWNLLEQDDVETTSVERNDYLHPIRRQNWVKITKEVLLDPATYADYLRLVERIETFLPNPTRALHKRSGLTAVDRSGFLDEIQKGFEVAYSETEPFDDESYFKNYFLLTSALRDALDDNRFLITGPKGTGKSALYKVLQKHAPLIQSPSYEKEARYVMGHGDPRARTNTAWLYAVEELQELERRREEAGIEPSLLWKRFWAVYAYLRLFQEIGGHERLPCWERAHVLAATLEHSTHLDALWPFLTDYHHTWQVDKALDEIESMQRTAGSKVVLLYDNLDKGFESDARVRREAVTGLLIFWQARFKRADRLVPKIFLRPDIWQSLEFANKTHLDSHRVNISWSKGDLHRLILKRAISASAKLRNLFSEQSLLDADPGRPLDERDLADEERVRAMINTLFGERVRQGKGFLYNWFENRLCDAHRNLYPRSAILLINKACGEAKNLSHSGDQTAILPGAALVRALPEVSIARVQELREEYADLSPLLRAWERRRERGANWVVPTSQTALEEQIKSDLPEQSQNAGGVVERLLQVGVLEKRSTSKDDSVRYTLPDLYLSGLGAIRKGPR